MVVTPPVTRPIRVLVFSPYYPPSIGGLQNHAQEFNQHLAAKGYQITLITPRLPRTALPVEHELSGVTILRFPAFELIPNFPVPKIWHRQFWAHWRTASHQAPDVVIGRTRFFATTWLARIFAWWHSLPYVHIEHGSDHVQLSNPLWHWLAYIIDHTIGRFVIETATKVVANSHHTAAFIKHLAPIAEPVIIYRGVETEKLEQIASARRATANPQLVRIGYLGRLIAGKGVSDLLLSLTSLKNQAWELLIIGHGPDYARLKEMTQHLGLNRSVQFIHPARWSEAVAIVKSCDIIVNPSYTEGLPTTVIEAALCQKAIIATHVGGTSEIIHHDRSGILIPPRNPTALARALEKLIRNAPLRTLLGTNAAQEVRGKFEWPRAIEAYHALFQQVI